MIQALIVVTFDVTGLHFWPKAPERRSYLGNSHRHRFMVRVSMPVVHDDREVEFHDLIDHGRGYMLMMRSHKEDFGSLSCEHMARFVADHLAKHYARQVTCSVFEDGECGAEVCATP